MQLDEAAHKRKAKARAARVLRCRCRLEAFERNRLVFRRDALARIVHIDPHFARSPLGTERHPAARRRVLDRIDDEIVDDLQDALLVSMQLAGLRRRLVHDLDLRLARAILDQRINALQHIGDVDILAIDLDRAGFDERQVENVINQRLERLGRTQDVREIGTLLVGQLAGNALLEEVGKAHDGIERRAQLVGHVRDEVGLQLVGGKKRLVALFQRLLAHRGVCHVAIGQQQRAVRQRCRPEAQHAFVYARQAFDMHLALLRGTGDQHDQLAPVRLVGQQRAAHREHFGKARLALQHDRVEAPEFGECLVEELQPAIRAKHRKGFGQVVDRGALHAGQLVEAALQRDLVGDVGIDEDQAAMRMRLAGHAQRHAARQVPVLLALFDGVRVEREALFLPAREVALLGQAAHFAQPLEDLAVRRMRAEPVFLEVPELGISLVRKLQALVRPEDRDRNRQAMQRLFMRVDVQLQKALRLVDVGDIDGERGNTILPHRNGGDVESAALAAHDDIALLGQRLVVADGAFRDLAAVAVKLDLVGHDVVADRRIDRILVGLVRPNEIQVGTAAPDRHRRNVEQVTQPAAFDLALREANRKVVV